MCRGSTFMWQHQCHVIFFCLSRNKFITYLSKLTFLSAISVFTWKATAGLDCSSRRDYWVHAAPMNSAELCRSGCSTTYISKWLTCEESLPRRWRGEPAEDGSVHSLSLMFPNVSLVAMSPKTPLRRPTEGARETARAQEVHPVLEWRSWRWGSWCFHVRASKF